MESKLSLIANRVRKILAEQNITQADLARRMTTDEGQVCRWLNGRTNITVKNILKMESALQRDIITIL